MSGVSRLFFFFKAGLQNHSLKVNNPQKLKNIKDRQLEFYKFHPNGEEAPRLGRLAAFIFSFFGLQRKHRALHKPQLMGWPRDGKME